MGQALRRGVEGYLAEVRRFQEWAACPDSHLTNVIAFVTRHPDWTFTDKRLDPAYHELRAHLRQIDARKMTLAKKRLAELEGEHRAAVRYAMPPDLDERTLEVAQHEVSRLSSRIKELEPERVPFLERYQTMLGASRRVPHQAVGAADDVPKGRRGRPCGQAGRSPQVRPAILAAEKEVAGNDAR